MRSTKGFSKALRSMALAAVAALLGAGVAGPAAALPVPISEGDDTECLARSSLSEGMNVPDAVNGNYWVRRDTFTINPQADCGSAFIGGISLIVRTPLEVDSTPEWDDLDSPAVNTSFADLTEAMRNLPETDGFHPSFTANAFGGPSAGAFENTFQGARICLSVGSALTIASCLAGSPMILTDIGGGYQIFTIELGEDSFFLDESEGDTFFDLITIAHSDVLGPVPSHDVPEMLVGWRFVAFAVPEPALALLLVPALLVALRRRAS